MGLCCEGACGTLAPMNSTAKTRFCPSPTGLIHLGNMRTALFNALYAASVQGTFLLRIEDTDVERSEEAYQDALMADLQWLGLAWQEGPEVGGDHAPYLQSKRQAVYDQYYDALVDSNQSYPCFCTEEDLTISRKIQRSQGKPPRYDGKCANLSETEVAAKKAQGIPHTLRFRVPRGEAIVFHDLVKGEQRFASDDIGDFIIRRANGTSPFLFCNAIDDALMGVTHALRGEDHVTNTPRQLMVLQALGLTPPQYGHISLIVGDDGAPLSKRNGSQSVQALKAQGYLPLAILNYLARLGHHYGNDAFMPLAQLQQQFSMDSLSSAPARFDVSQLDHWQREAMAQLDGQAFWAWCESFVTEQVTVDRQDDFVSVVQANCVFPSDVQQWADCLCKPFRVTSQLDHPAIQSLTPLFFETALASLAKGEDYATMTAAIKSTCDVKGARLFMPLRWALTGVLGGPELPKIMAFLGIDESRARLEAAKGCVA